MGFLGIGPGKSFNLCVSWEKTAHRVHELFFLTLPQPAFWVVLALLCEGCDTPICQVEGNGGHSSVTFSLPIAEMLL